MEDRKIVSELTKFLSEEFPNPAVELTVDTHLLDDWFIDSLGLIHTVLFLEETFDIEIARADINGDNFKNIRALADLVNKRLAG